MSDRVLAMDPLPRLRFRLILSGMVVSLVTSEQVEALEAVAEQLEARGLKVESRAVRDIVAQMRQTPEEVSAATAAGILHVTPRTVRGWIRRRILPGRRDQRGRFQVSLRALEPTMRLNELMPNQPDTQVAVTDDEIEAEILAVRAARRAQTPRG